MVIKWFSKNIIAEYVLQCWPTKQLPDFERTLSISYFRGETFMFRNGTLIVWSFIRNASIFKIFVLLRYPSTIRVKA